MSKELKPVPCGCGGEAKLEMSHDINGTEIYQVRCPDCGIRIGYRYTEGKAVEAWNRAMGERTAKVTYLSTKMGLSFCCGNCGKPVHSEGKYCHHCGCRLDWSERDE